MATTAQTEIREEVRRRYAASAINVNAGCCESSSCGPSDQDISIDQSGGLYGSGELHSIPSAAAQASLGCGNPTAVADLAEGETVLDLGSGGGIDVLLSARRVGATGFAYGLDMTDEMLDLARRNAAESGASNVEFLKGYIEAIPLGGASVDVVISNCVINLSVDKPTVFDEMYRVLKPGGRIGISDIVSADALSPEDRAERGSWVGCIAGALTVSEYENGLRRAGFTGISLTPTHAVANGLESMIIRGTKPS
jgi:arsenite methyltransferase